MNRFLFSEINRCLLCVNAPCEQIANRNVKAAERIRALSFADPYRALIDFDYEAFKADLKEAENKCVFSEFGNPIPISKIFEELDRQKDKYEASDFEPDISTDICGVRLENPYLLSSSVVASNYEMCAKAFQSGWAGVCFKTICSFEQRETSPRFSALKDDIGTFYGFKNIEQLSDHAVEENLEIFRHLKKEYPNKVIIASIMGKNAAEWERLSRACDEAGADAIELNFSCPNLENGGLGITIGQSEELTERFTRAARKGTKKPLLVKLTPNVADMVPFALAAKRGGCDGIAAINTILSITGVNVDTYSPEPSIRGKSTVGGYSGNAVRPIALRFIADLTGTKELSDQHISAMGGIESWHDGLEFIILGASSLQITTAVMQYGYRIIDDLICGLKGYMKARDIRSLKELIGIGAGNVVRLDELDRDTILYPRFNYELCVGCGRCYLSCYDGGHQAIVFGEDRKPKLIGRKCVGCHLCRLVCPSQAIAVADKRVSKSGL